MENMENKGVNTTETVVNNGGLNGLAGGLIGGVATYILAEVVKNLVVKPAAKFIGKKIENRRNATKKVKTKPTVEVNPESASEEEGVK